MDVGNAFESPEYLAEWATKEAKKFTSVRKEFFSDPNVCARVVEFDPEIGENVIKMRLFKILPVELRGLASNAIKNFRDALDQTTFAATFLIRDKGSNRAHFPFGENPDDLENSLSRRKSVPCKGLAEELFPVLRECEPYPTGDGYTGGNDVLRALARVSGDNKHAVTLTVSAAVDQTTINPGVVQVGPGGATLYVPPEWDAVKNEIKLWSFPPGSYVNVDMSVALAIGFGPGPLERYAVEFFLDELARDVPVIINRIKQATAKIIVDR
ncbi:MAG: hypothetical protein BVN33_06265 [Proteobacteria bacterium ST_bin13]|nr:MAG: hypothetical protein BVN33_06265 [Proteobacteria bacterium ST_bin13]